jgi:hypothetical protein
MLTRPAECWAHRWLCALRVSCVARSNCMSYRSNVCEAVNAIPALCCRPATTFFSAPNASPGESGICWSSLTASDEVGRSIMLNLRCTLSTTRLMGRAVSNEALSKAPEVGLDVGRAILKKFDLSSPPLSALACLRARRCVCGCGCGMLKEVLRLMVAAGSSSSDSVSSSSQSPGY